MSATQLILIALVLLAFAIGWIARGKRTAADIGSDLDRAAAAQGVANLRAVADLDAAIGAALTAFQAALALWQAEAGMASTRGARALAAFDRRRRSVERLSAELSLSGELSTEAQAALTRTEGALGRLSDGLSTALHGETLDPERARSLLRAERALMAARSALLLGAAGVARPPVT